MSSPCHSEVTVTQREQEASVLVGVVTHNRASVLPVALKSALAQTHRPLRISVVDDASTDDTPGLREDFPMVGWSRVEPGRGYLDARNRMMLTARESFYVSLDDDAWFLAGDEIALAVAYLERNPTTAAIAFQIVSPDRPDLSPRGKPAAASLFIGCGHVLRLSVVKELGGYSRFPGTYGAEEKDLCLRLIDAGYGIVALPGVHVWHDKSELGRDVARQYRSGVCNDLALTVRRVPLPQLLALLPYKFILHLVSGVRRGMLRQCLQGMRDFVRAAWGLWRERAPVRFSSFRALRALDKAPRKVAS
jgi:GT2 family glycosyltransferase